MAPLSYENAVDDAYHDFPAFLLKKIIICLFKKTDLF